MYLVCIKVHERLFRVCEHELISVKDSATWLTKGNIKPRDEGAYCFLQDRNVFFGENVKCPHCRSADKTEDHLATKCDRMLGHDTQGDTMKFLNVQIYHYATNTD